MGEGEEVGVVPRFMEELFERIAGTSDSKVLVYVCVTCCGYIVSFRIHLMCKSVTLRFIRRRCMTC